MSTTQHHAETLQFEAEVAHLMKLVVDSLYTHKEIFLRELVANAYDALDRLRIEALTRPEIAPGQEPRIMVVPDNQRRTLTVHDNGIGMRREEVISNIGTIARSGTAELVQALREKSAREEAEQLIGRFGVGFYSSFMVAERVELLTRRAGEEEATYWRSTGDGKYFVREAERDGQGTSVILHLKPVDRDDGVDDYTDSWTLQRIIKQHCDFISYPIVLAIEKEVSVEEKGKEVSDAKAWEHEERIVNSMRPIWERSSTDVTDEEYKEFYKTTFQDWTEPLEIIHQRGEGTIEYQALLFIPSQARKEVYYAGFKPGLRLYASRLLVLETSEELLPRYLRFLRGVVDSPDLPLNVSRERLQNDRNLSLIRKALVNKTLNVLAAIQQGSRDRYEQFWRHFGRAVKEGIGQEWDHSEALNKLLMFESSRDAEALTSLQEYVDRMPSDQEAIYYLTGPSRSVIENSPSLEIFREKGFEVFYLSDPVDELVAQSLSEFDGKRFQSVGKGALELGSEDEKSRENDEVEEEEFTHLLEALEQRLGPWVKQVRLSGRLTQSPVVLVGAEHDYSPHLEQMLSTGINDAPKQRRIMELNPRHEVVMNLRRRFEADPEDPRISDYGELLLGWGLIAEGSGLYDPVRYNRLFAELMGRELA